MAKIKQFTSIEICAGAGGQALGLEKAGFQHLALIEIEKTACNTLRLNRPHWNIIENDMGDFSGKPFKGIDLLAGGVPCSPFSKAGKQLGSKDERDLFPQALRLADEIRPQAIMLENVRGFLDPVFEDYRYKLKKVLNKLGYFVDYKLLNAADFGVSQLRCRVVLVALRKELADYFSWPEAYQQKPQTVGHLLFDLMAARAWKGARRWREIANQIAPTLVGGSHKHGGADLGPSRAKKAWAVLNVDGHSIADFPPEENFMGMPRLTIRMTARIQGFPDSWEFSGKKTAVYKQIGNAFPSPVAQAVGEKMVAALNKAAKYRLKKFIELNRFAVFAIS